MKRLHDLIAQGEHEQQDFKYKVTDAIKLARSVSAFANTNGGRLLIGLHAEGRTIVIATVPPSTNRPVFALNEEGKQTAYVRVNDENIVATAVHLEIWKQERAATGTVTTFSDDERKLLQATGALPDSHLNRIIKMSGINRRKAIIIMAKMVRFGLVQMYFADHRFLFRECGNSN